MTFVEFIVSTLFVLLIVGILFGDGGPPYEM